MSARRIAEAAVAATLFVLTGILPAVLLLAVIGSILAPAGEVYDDTVAGAARGLVRDVRDPGAAGAVPIAILVLGAGFGLRRAIRGRASHGARVVGRATVLAILLGVALGASRSGEFPWPYPSAVPDHAPLRVAVALATTGLLLWFSLSALGALRRRSP